MAFDPPVLINVRDRLKDLCSLIEWLERAGHRRITLLDNASTFPPLLAYLAASPHEVRYLGENLGSRALWDAGLVPDEPFVLTDPDIVPLDTCPLDAVAHLQRLLDAYPSYSKAGLGLYLDDVEFPSKGWERTLVSRETAPGVFDSLIDTTFALYRPGASFAYEAIRTGAPYLARHGSWYVTEPDAEDAYYLERAETGPTGSSWKEGLASG
jgi:hypothetical protein